VFKYLLISIAIVPALMGVIVAKQADGARGWATLRLSWILYAVLWFGVVYYLRFRWS